MVAGSISATLMQECVRTCEPFPVDMNFEIASVIKAVEVRERDDSNAVDLQLSVGDTPKKKGKRKANRRKDISEIDDMDIQELQQVMEEFGSDLDVIEDLMIFKEGVVDAGELAAQLLRLELDPFPKKPGSEPINLSFSG